MVKLFQYKQVARITLLGYDDILIDDANSIYKTQMRGGFHNNNEINTKLLKFKLDNNIQNLQFSNNAKLVIESVYVPNICDYDITAVPPTFAPDIKNTGSISLRMKGINNDTFDSMTANANTMIFTNSTTNNTFYNTNPDKLYNFSVSSNFLRNGFIEIEMIFDMFETEDIDIVLNKRSITSFFISFVIYDENQEELLLKDTDEADFKLMKPFNNGIPIYK